MRTTAQQQADMEGSTYVSTSEWNGYLNAGYQELYNLLVTLYGENYFTIGNYQLTTDGTNEYYNLPDGTSTYKLSDATTTAPAFFKLLGVDVWISATNTSPSQWFTLNRFNFGERNRSTGTLPQSNQLIQIHYIPRLTKLASDTDTADLVSGWEEYIVVDAVIKAKMKEESDVSAHMARKMDLRQQIEAAATNRDAGEPQTVVDASSSGGGGWPYIGMKYRLAGINGKQLWLRQFGRLDLPSSGWGY